MRIGLAGAGRIGARHAETLRALPSVEAFVVADPDDGRARRIAEEFGGSAADSVDALFGERLDGLVVAAATDAHAELVTRAARAGIPTFCEKPVAPDSVGTLQVVREVQAAATPVQVGFQRRFDAGHVALRDAVATGRLGRLHTVRSCTLDPAPPPATYVRVSGGIFRDCAVHDIDAIRFVTGRQVVEVMATGANKGEEYFAACGDVDTCAAVLTLDDGTLAIITETRYNGAGYDVRIEAYGAEDSLAAGLGDGTPLTPVDGHAAGATPGARPCQGFLERFGPAYEAELATFLQVAAGRADSPCPPEEALEAFYVAEACDRSRRERRAVTIEEVRR
ncbi:Gfo/Idh/MocA family oxidoreductase [Actinoallomurus spadix]|uniref:Gfo/Idh/MocA family oxidoreductase n=1 Tax=Actinoallomurus spadix TaxID=79912 RepID=A0ABP3GTP6_9ACTN|nr:Gfo/Idh/MocA family oxidoreductase [Actinoallomurus spadix]MCO5986034.1 Gfo/Idh/MocA family oxidoreductase [Actinoallomurus spadix]